MLYGDFCGDFGDFVGDFSDFGYSSHRPATVFEGNDSDSYEPSVTSLWTSLWSGNDIRLVKVS